MLLGGAARLLLEPERDRHELLLGHGLGGVFLGVPWDDRTELVAQRHEVRQRWAAHHEGVHGAVRAGQAGFAPQQHAHHELTPVDVALLEDVEAVEGAVEVLPLQACPCLRHVLLAMGRGGDLRDRGEG